MATKLEKRISEIHLRPDCRTDCLGISYIYGGTVAYRPGENLVPRVLSDYELVLILDGHVTYTYNDHSQAVPPGTIILAQPGFKESYQWDPKRETRHVYLHFSLESIPGSWAKRETWPVVVEKPDPLCTQLLQHIVRRCHAKPNWPAEPPHQEMCCLMKTLLDTLFCQPQANPSQPSVVRPQPVQQALQHMREVIDEEPERPLRLPEIASVANISAKHLCRLFQSSIGCSPMHAYRLLRLQLALALLSRSNLTIKQIANRCGFASQFQFSRCFAETFGHAPTIIRQKLLCGEPPPTAYLPPDVMPRLFW
jgi:AraC-like DNA-binding protein